MPLNRTCEHFEFATGFTLQADLALLSTIPVKPVPVIFTVVPAVTTRSRVVPATTTLLIVGTAALAGLWTTTTAPATATDVTRIRVMRRAQALGCVRIGVPV